MKKKLQFDLNQVAELSSIAEKVLKNELSKEGKQEKLVESMIEDANLN